MNEPMSTCFALSALIARLQPHVRIPLELLAMCAPKPSAPACIKAVRGMCMWERDLLPPWNGLAHCLCPVQLVTFRLSASSLLGQVCSVTKKVLPVAMPTAGALVVQDVHARDVVAALAEKQVEEEDAFDWQAQMRRCESNISCVLYMALIRCLQDGFPVVLLSSRTIVRTEHATPTLRGGRALSTLHLDDEGIRIWSWQGREAEVSLMYWLCR